MSAQAKATAALVIAFVAMGAACAAGPEPATDSPRARGIPPEQVFKFPTRTPTPTATATATLTPTPIPPTPTLTPTPIPPPAPAAPPAYSAQADAASAMACAFEPAVMQWAPLLSAYGWNLCSALRIVDCESNGDPWVYNQSGSGACGLWQHLPCQHAGDAAASTALAWEKYQARGWQPWIVGGCYP